MAIVLQIPGGIGGLEVAVILSIVFILFFLALAVIAIIYALRRLTSPDEDRIDELERRVEELESGREE